MAQTKVTAEIIRDVLDYDAATGVFRWKNPPSRRMHAGDVAGDVKSNGRRYISVCGEPHLAHRLAWLYVRGEWPDGYVRHRNEQFDDNRWENLYEATGSATNLTRRLSKSNTSGHAGVSYSAPKNRWKAYIKRGWQNVHLGWFATREEAIAAREKAERELDGAPEVSETINRIVDHERGRQRQRTAYRVMCEAFPDNGWHSIGEFIGDVGEAPGARYTVVPRDANLPVGPDNFEWLAPPSERFDMDTAAGRAARKREIYAATPEKQRRYELRKRYSLTDEQIDSVIARERGLCECCGQPERATESDGSARRLNLDHDHLTEAPRGVICLSCNMGIGQLGDSVSSLLIAARYKARWAREGEIEDAAEILRQLAEDCGFELVPALAAPRKESA